ncbi:Fanconi anemia core complex-associated protein 20 [Galemys pyrenaicus]|uniref:Fanconi anemia core complex-associated protein 20 n=1 Tax=Galemys pyrenaicus TaxID=202257 RepID=A0A8J6DGJ5_GALPY|nr:Fanconi anemia core complex-associated protein 20 [Galemys pyrenaicus]
MGGRVWGASGVLGGKRAPGCRPCSLEGRDGESAGPWAQLLRAVCADSTLDAEPLPAFPAQEPRHDPQRAATPEVFSVGGETFSWTPFPPAPGDGRSRSYRVLRAAPRHPASPARPPPPSPEPQPRRAPCAQEPRAVEEAPALRSCPLCQAAFGPGLAPLDVDAHLAQCLAESTEDVVW